MSYSALSQHFQQQYHLQHIAAICGWDQATMMPAGGNQARAEAMSTLAVLSHQQLQDPRLADWFAAAESPTNTEPALTAEQKISLQAMQRQWRDATMLPSDLVGAFSLAGSRCEHAWRSLRPANDWAGFLPLFEEVLNLSRQVAAARAEVLGLSRYDSLLEQFEPGMRTATLDPLFDGVKQWLPSLITEVQAKQAGDRVLQPQGSFATAQQKALGLEIMQLLGFDFNHGRLDVSVHPFCGGVSEDVRLTTRYDEQDVAQALMGVIHETGHARYEQGLPAQWRSLPVGQARSMGVHESQSLFFEMQLARHPAFIAKLAPLLVQQFGEQPAFSADNLSKLYTRVKPGLIRVDADEVTYPAHVMLRYEIERDLIEGKLQAKDLPERWDQLMQQYLGISTQGNYKDGCMQDIHWTDGSFGYFPSYTLGAMYAAQQAQAMQTELGSFDQLISQDLPSVFDWLQHNIWQHASLLETDQLITQACGQPLTANAFKLHLEQRYLR
ncbi:carboxypeptidase M32 [Oceanisphaera profunda]|uniref:Metal-dependent carboxypeptidase n=1 Tax=Oceanisphaera profunda TaxID=1416627 RepID=A0A1Y0D3F3_9GAMM|nr:carboxypeptidase M32 [Oceanisphaera profunda]ART81736.1 carboxypeptidase M32 [Oceanisphaera profunda]